MLTCSSAGVRSSRRAVCTTMKGLRPAMASVWALGTGFCRPGRQRQCGTFWAVAGLQDANAHESTAATTMLLHGQD